MLVKSTRKPKGYELKEKIEEFMQNRKLKEKKTWIIVDWKRTIIGI